MRRVLRVAMLVVSISLSASMAGAQASGVTMVVESVESPARVGELVVLDVKVTNASKDAVVFQETQRRGWSTTLYRTDDPKHADLLAMKRQKTLDALSASKTESSEDMGATLEVAPGENPIFRVPIETSDLNLQPGSYTVVVRRYDMKSNIDIVSSPFVIMLAQHQ